MIIQPIVISAPFGNYINIPNATSTVGSFTQLQRAGITKRIWKVLQTVRYYPRLHSWVNKLGLPNPGINTFLETELDLSRKIISLYGFDESEWNYLAGLMTNVNFSWIEMNLSCPNVSHTQSLRDSSRMVEYFADRLIAKLPPIDWFNFASVLYFNGVRAFHLCNTIPTPGGGMSGKILKQYSLWAIREFRQKYGTSVRIIGGGGITSEADIYDYMKAGADHFALGSMLFNPRNHKVATKLAKKFWCYSYTEFFKGNQQWTQSS